MITPARVIEAQADLVARTTEGRDYEKIVTEWMKMSYGPLALVNDDEKPARTMRIMHTAAQMAHPFRVSARMTEHVIAGANALDSADIMDGSSAPFHTGLAYFEGGFDITSVSFGNVREDDERTLTGHWLLWTAIGTPDNPVRPNEDHDDGFTGGLAWFMFNDLLDDPDPLGIAAIRRMGGKSLIEMIGRWNLAGFGSGRWGQPVGDDLIARTIASFWLLTGQEITETVPYRTPPAMRAVSKKAKIGRDVSVIELRRRKIIVEGGPEAEPTGRHVSVRFPVRGHWRNQAYGPKRTQRKKIWIADTWRGPDDAPLSTRPRVYDLRR